MKPATLRPSFFGDVLVVRRDAEAVGLLVVEDEDLLAAELLREQRVGRALEVVGRDDADVVPLAGRVVLVGLAGAVPGPACVRPTYVFAGLTMPTGPSGRGSAPG